MLPRIHIDLSRIYVTLYSYRSLACDVTDSDSALIGLKRRYLTGWTGVQGVYCIHMHIFHCLKSVCFFQVHTKSSNWVQPLLDALLFLVIVGKVCNSAWFFQYREPHSWISWSTKSDLQMSWPTNHIYCWAKFHNTNHKGDIHNWSQNEYYHLVKSKRNVSLTEDHFCSQRWFVWASTSYWNDLLQLL